MQKLCYGLKNVETILLSYLMWDAILTRILSGSSNWDAGVNFFVIADKALRRYSIFPSAIWSSSWLKISLFSALKYCKLYSLNLDLEITLFSHIFYLNM